MKEKSKKAKQHNKLRKTSLVYKKDDSQISESTTHPKSTRPLVDPSFMHSFDFQKLQNNSIN